MLIPFQYHGTVDGCEILHQLKMAANIPLFKGVGGLSHYLILFNII